MPSRSSTRAGLAGAAALLCAASAGTVGAAPPAAPTLCPARIDTEQGSAAAAGWSVERSGVAAKPLAEIAFFEGPVRDRVQLAPSSEAPGKATWTFAAGARSVRIACLYRGTDVALSRPLPAGVRTCAVALDPRSPVVRPEALSCR